MSVKLDWIKLIGRHVIKYYLSIINVTKIDMTNNGNKNYVILNCCLLDVFIISILIIRFWFISYNECIKKKKMH